MARRMGRRLSLLLLVAAMPFALWAALQLGSSGQSLQQKIDRGRAKIDPILARTALGENGSAQPGPRTSGASSNA